MSHPIYQAAVFGATSTICLETLRALVHEQPARLLLIGRNPEKLAAVADDLRCRGAQCQTRCASFEDFSTDWRALLENESNGQPWNLFLIAQGSLPDQDQALNDPKAIALTLGINFTSPALIAAACAAVLDQQNHGTLAVIGSVAGDRGRGSIFLYGSAKAGIDTFLAGLRHRFAQRPNIHIVTLKPGTTDTPMTAHLPRGPLFSSAEKVGALAWKAISAETPVAYLPGWWKFVMAIIRRLPACLFHRSRL
jgi:NAD(P)-dependent dehydrogenase (short-subunit alcohol dehydrogenase family)